MFALLGMHRGPDISLPAAASLAALPAARTRPVLTELAGASLITEYRPGRYILHDLLRAYAAEQAAAQCDEEETRAATGRGLEHYLYTLTGFPSFGQLPPFRAVPPPGPGVSPEQPAGQAAMLSWLESEHPVLRQAIEQAADTGFTARAWQLYYCFAHACAWQGKWGMI